MPRWSPRSPARSPSAPPRRSALRRPDRRRRLAQGRGRRAPTDGSRGAGGWPITARRWSARWRCSGCSAFYYVAWQRAGRDPRAGHGGADLLAARRSQPGGDALHVEDGRRQPRLRRRPGRPRRARPGPPGRGRRRLAFERQDAARAAGGGDSPCPTAEQAMLDELVASRRIDRHGAEEPRQILAPRRRPWTTLSRDAMKASCSTATGAGRCAGVRGVRRRAVADRGRGRRGDRRAAMRRWSLVALGALVDDGRCC